MKYHGGVVIDPFARDSLLGSITNDLNPECKTTYNLDALDFLKLMKSNSADLILFDPPYSLRQVKECYDGIGLSLTGHQSRHFFSDIKNEIKRVLKIGGIVISFGWDSNGMGINRGFDKIELLLVAHGGIHHDTICLIESKSS